MNVNLYATDAGREECFQIKLKSATLWAWMDEWSDTALLLRGTLPELQQLALSLSQCVQEIQQWAAAQAAALEAVKPCRCSSEKEAVNV